jgi:transposase InsO family protein
VRTGQGWLHLAIVLDLYARRLVGWAMVPLLDQRLAHQALAMALAERRPAPGLLFHSDRGGPFLSLRVQQLARRAGLILSTRRPGRCLDNAVAESFFHTLKTELVYQTAIARARRRAWRSSSTSPPSTTEPVGTRAMPLAHPTSRKPSTPSVVPSPVSTFLAQLSRLMCGLGGR